MPQVHIVSKSHHNPNCVLPVVNRVRAYEQDAEKAVALVHAAAFPFEHVELAWSEIV